MLTLCSSYLQGFAQRVLGGGILQTFSASGVDVDFPPGLLADLEEIEVFQVTVVISSDPYSWVPQDFVINSIVSRVLRTHSCFFLIY